MKITPKYSDSIVALPGAALNCISEAGRCELAVLIYVMANHNVTISACTGDLGINRERLIAALDFWKDAGVLTYSGLRSAAKSSDGDEHEETDASPVEKKSVRAAAGSAAGSSANVDGAEKVEYGTPREEEFVQMTMTETADGDFADGDATGEKPATMGKRTVRSMRSAAQLPAYTAADITRLVKDNSAVSRMLYSCQQSLGKVFNVAETEILVGLLDYLRLTPEYVMILCSYLGGIGKNSVRYVEKTAIGYFDRGITDEKTLTAYIEREEAVNRAEGQLRKMFGIGDRALTKKEKALFARWCGEWRIPMDMVNLAYEIAVNNTGKASVAYTGGVLERWYNSGCRTAAEVEALASNKFAASNKFPAADNPAAGKKTGGVPTKGSFNTDEFFEAAIERSYRDKTTE